MGCPRARLAGRAEGRDEMASECVWGVMGGRRLAGWVAAAAAGAAAVVDVTAAAPRVSRWPRSRGEVRDRTGCPSACAAGAPPGTPGRRGRRWRGTPRPPPAAAPPPAARCRRCQSQTPPAAAPRPRPGGGAGWVGVWGAGVDASGERGSPKRAAHAGERAQSCRPAAAPATEGVWVAHLPHFAQRHGPLLHFKLPPALSQREDRVARHARQDCATQRRRGQHAPAAVRLWRGTEGGGEGG